ncbi:MAG: glycosyltransferase [Archangiaceae bacterium]|nr:glycosyltransferase [Archangiaceae bacterium]
MKGLADRFQVVVLSTKTPDHSHIERYHGARLLRVPVGSGDLQSRIQAFDRAVRRQLESEEYAVAHFFDPFGGYALCEARGQYGFRLVYDAQTFPSQELRYTHPGTESDRRFLSKVRRQELYCLMNADAVICGSEVTRDWVLSLGAPPMSLHVFPQPVDPAPFAGPAVGRPDGTPMKLLHLGSQLPYQGLSTLLRAMQIALQKADLRLMVVGPRVPDGQVPFDELVAELKLTGKVEFVAPVPHDDLPKVLANSDVGVLALDGSDRNRGQGGPLAKVADYLTAGRPVIAADLPVTRELLPEGARLLFPPDDFKALAELLVKLASSPALRVELGEAARAGSKRFDAPTVRGRLIGLYDLLSARGKANAPSEAQGEITELRKTAGGEGAHPARPDAAPSETLDEEPEAPPVVAGQALEQPAGHDERARAAVTEPGVAAQSTPEPTPIIKARRKKKTTDEMTPIGRAPQAPVETGLGAGARGRRTLSKSHHRAVAPPPPSSPTPGQPDAPVRIRRTSEKGMRSPLAAPRSPAPDPLAATMENPVAPSGSSAGNRAVTDLSPSVIVDIDAGLPKPAAPASVARQPLIVSPAQGTARAPPASLAAPEADLPKIARRGPLETRNVRVTDQVPVLVPSHSPPATPARPLPSTSRITSAASAHLAPPSLEALPPPPLPPPPITAETAKLQPDEPDEISSDEIESVEEEAPREPVSGGKLDPWLQQLLWGYCPPDAVPFERPPPPTNFPGRET